MPVSAHVPPSPHPPVPSDQVHSRREGECAILEAADPHNMSVQFRLGPRVHSMTDTEILQEWNRTAEATEQLAKEYEHVSVEVPPGRPQVTFSERSGTWVARGDVLRCYIDMDPETHRPLIHIDETALTFEGHQGW